MLNTNRIFYFLLSLLVLSEVVYGFLYSGFSTQIILFIVVSIIASVLYILISLIVHFKIDELPKNTWKLFIVFAFVFRLTLVWIQPIASGDVNRYIWDGKVQVNGFNPYGHAPTDSSLNGLHSATLPQSMDFPNMRSIYPPFAEWVFALAYKYFGENPFGIKVFLLLAELITTWLLILVLKEAKKPLANIALYLLCPLPIMQFMIDAHMDALVFPFFLLFILYWMKRKTIAGSVSLGFAIITKLLPLLFLPLALKGEKNGKRFMMIAGSLGVVFATYVPYVLWNGSPWESLGAYSARWYFNGPVFDLILPSVGSNELAHMIVAGLFLAWYLFVLTRPWTLLEMIYYTLIGFFILSATVHPWYVIWLAVLLPLTTRWSGIAYITLINLANIVVIDYKAFKIWHLSPAIEVLEYLPILFFLFWELKSYFTAARPPATAVS
jgi:alpha-1,6-mannosyltransferase